jgi:YesN/AraC family two-component response regulator
MLPIIKNPKLRDAALYIESHYGDTITLSDISANAGINHTTLTALMKEELGCTAIEYLMQYRITIAKKQLAFIDVPIDDVPGSCRYDEMMKDFYAYIKGTKQNPFTYEHDYLVQKVLSEIVGGIRFNGKNID